MDEIEKVQLVGDSLGIENSALLKGSPVYNSILILCAALPDDFDETQLKVSCSALSYKEKKNIEHRQTYQNLYGPRMDVKQKDFVSLKNDKLEIANNNKDYLKFTLKREFLKIVQECKESSQEVLKELNIADDSVFNSSLQALDNEMELRLSIISSDISMIFEKYSKLIDVFVTLSDDIDFLNKTFLELREDCVNQVVTYLRQNCESWMDSLQKFFL